MRKLYIVLIIIALVILTGIFVYWINVPKINYSCKVDSDCIIVDKHNCCGYYPVCANKNSKPNPGFVRFTCGLSGSLSVCGFHSIDRCECLGNKCKGTFNGHS
ncbi:MAG: hypothetical protein QXP53_00635 [Candidatus Pacearchaeota archaeon]